MYTLIRHIVRIPKIPQDMASPLQTTFSCTKDAQVKHNIQAKKSIFHCQTYILVIPNAQTVLPNSL